MTPKRKYEGSRVKCIHPISRVSCNGIVAGMDEKAGITIVSEENPERIIFCAIPSDPGFIDDYNGLKEAIDKGIPFDEAKILAEAEGFPPELVEYILSQMSFIRGNTGTSQEELEKRCAFNTRKN